MSFSLLSFGDGNDQLIVNKTTFQIEVESCQKKLKLKELRIEKVKSLQTLYDEVEKQYLLLSENILQRDIVYNSTLNQKDQKKIKVINDQIKTFDIDSEGRLVERKFDAKQKPNTIQGKVNQLLLNAKIEEDLGEIKETREKGIVITYLFQLKMKTQIQIERVGFKDRLICKSIQNTEFCICH